MKGPNWADHPQHKAWASQHEASINAGRGRTTLEPGQFLCMHNFVTRAVRRDPTLDNNAVQAAGQAACKAAQLAELEAKAA